MVNTIRERCLIATYCLRPMAMDKTSYTHSTVRYCTLGLVLKSVSIAAVFIPYTLLRISPPSSWDYGSFVRAPT